ncbi:MAG: hypothetical protein AB2L20_15025 [Mangrovibacterium sp.]
MAHSKGTWKLGHCGSVVTDNGDGFPLNTGHDDIEYYGGYLIAESIYNIDNAKLIAAAPDMLEALLEYKRLYESVQPSGGWQGVYDMGNYAIKKATEQ